MQTTPRLRGYRAQPAPGFAALYNVPGRCHYVAWPAPQVAGYRAQRAQPQGRRCQTRSAQGLQARRSVRNGPAWG